MVAVNPKILRDDVGFQLSFAAVAGLMYLQPLLEKLFSWVTPRGGLRPALAMTLAANIYTLPLIATQFGRVSLISPLANMLVFLVSTAVMLPGAAGAVVAGMMAPAWAWLPLLPAHILMAYLTAVGEQLARWPLAQLQVLWPGALLVPSYVGLAWATRWLRMFYHERERYRVKVKTNHENGSRH
jgi:competence protein ComEC